MADYYICVSYDEEKVGDIMFFIFGWSKTAKPIESVLKAECFHCKNVSGWSIWKETDWVSLFFVRVIPLHSKYHLICNICNDAIPLTSSLAKEILNPEKRTDELHNTLVENIEKYQFKGMSETQKQYWKSKL